MRGEESNAVLLVVRLIGVEHTIEPGKKLRGTVVAVKYDGARRMNGRMNGRMGMMVIMRKYMTQC